MRAKNHKWIAIGIIAIPAALILFFALAAALFWGDLKNISLKRLAVIRMEGVITDSDWHVKTLREYRHNKNIAGVLLRIDSPGGAVAPSQEIYNEIAAYKAVQKPVVVSMGNMAASGGYYIASPADKIFASQGTITGSIGVIFTLPLYQELAKKVGVEFRVFKAGAFKDMGSPYRSMSDNEAKVLQNLLDNTHEQFINDVAAGRGVEAEVIRKAADGRIFTGKQAYEHGLVDTIGGYAQAIDYLRMICGVPESVKPVEKRQQSGWRELLLESASKNFRGALGTISRPAGLYFLYEP
ncbi:MAG: signal peptide peptidase SppA [Chitinispirillales bacterium]|jgi:protease-4|nr:signal peptide peptidase SppA [Chitinispirillales bacterium]